jgi:hypothetical protein
VPCRGRGASAGLAKKNGGSRSSWAHLLDVLEIVAADAPDAADRKEVCGACDREGGLGGGRE